MLNRREFLATGAALGTAGAMPALPALGQEAYVIPEAHLPIVVRVPKDTTPHEIHVDPNRFFLFWTLPDGKAIRYVVGVGKVGLYQAGEFHVGRKREWPSWTPTPSMIARNPAYAKWSGGMPGGPSNPLGARALYLYRPRGGDSMLRIHGTPEPWTLGRRVSNGCARLANSHIAHLYEQVPVGTRVVLHPMGAIVATS